MNEIRILGECVIVGICGFAAVQHALVAARRPLDWMHLLFAILCLMAALHFLDKAAIALQPGSTEPMTALHRWRIITSILFFVTLAWFVAEFTNTRPWWLLIGLSLLFLVAFRFRLLMPFAILLLAGFSLYACVRQYRRGARRRALTLGIGMALFLFFLLPTIGVRYAAMNFYGVSEFGFLSLIAIMSFHLMQELSESQQHMHVVLDNVPVAIYLKDSRGRYVWTNRQFQDWFHTNQASIYGKRDGDLGQLFPLHSSGSEQPAYLTSDSSRSSEIELSRDGEVHTFKSRTASLPQNANQLSVCGVLTDISELRHAEQEAQQARQQLWRADRVASINTLSASLAHELNQPLTAILSNAQAGIRFLHGGKPDLGEIRAIFNDIVRDDKRAGEVIGGLRSMLQRHESVRSQMNLADSAQEVLNFLNSELLNAQIRLDTQFQKGCVVTADKTLIQQVQLNLILNAIEAMHSQPAPMRRLDIAINCVDNSICKFIVRDHGTGISTEGFRKLFNMFTTSKPKGMGIGLAISRSIIESHGGEIWAERNLDNGLTFIFTLPAVTGTAAANEGRA